MISSMTGFAVKTREIGHGTLSMEIKSVNSRYLDVFFRLGEEFRMLEPALRELIGKYATRGKIECRLNFIAAAGGERDLALNEELLARLVVLDEAIRRSASSAKPLSVGEYLRWPGILADSEIDFDAVHAQCMALAAEVLEDFVAARRREGEKLVAMIRERLVGMRRRVEEVAPRIPAAQAAFEEKLRQRLLESLNIADDERIRQEVALFAARIDVAEELSRLSTHIEEVERILAAGGASGKRLDFLMQELNREANTLGSKAGATEVTTAAMDLKLLIEQMREQIQNLE